MSFPRPADPRPAFWRCGATDSVVRVRRKCGTGHVGGQNEHVVEAWFRRQYGPLSVFWPPDGTTSGVLGRQKFESGLVNRQNRRVPGRPTRAVGPSVMS